MKKVDRYSIKQTYSGSWSLRLYYADGSFDNKFFDDKEALLDGLEDIIDGQ